MSRIFGAVRQIAYVVRDMDAALRYWTETLGVGPFWLFPVKPESYSYRGTPSAPPTLKIALGNSGDVQVELIQQMCDSPSPFRDYLDSGREGFQHVSSWHTPAEYDDLRSRLVAQGVVIAHEGSMSSSGPRFANFATDSYDGGPQYEIADPFGTPLADFFQHIAAAAKTWDGSDAVREAV